MPKYTLRTHPDYSLTVDGETYRNGDPIEISEEQAKDIAYASKWHRFETSPDAPTIGADRHRSGRRPPEGVELDQKPPADE
jgi:hypothetical protein